MVFLFVLLAFFFNMVGFSAGLNPGVFLEHLVGVGVAHGVNVVGFFHGGGAGINVLLGVVLQHPVLFNDSVRANLTLGREADDATLWQALDIAQLKDVVAELPHGLDTVVGRQGVRLSGGQRQRLAIARMIVANPSVVILDEATSALDTDTERHLHQAMHQFLAGRTTLIIAHRLSAVRQADRILVFENGRVVEAGGHAELMEKGGLYHKLYQHP